jgi:hypothetical protein
MDWAASRFGEGHVDIGNLAAGSSGDLAYSIDIGGTLPWSTARRALRPRTG